VKSILLGAVFAMASLLPARAVVIHHLSMQKMAVISDVVVLCEEVEIGYDVIEHREVIIRKAVVRCKPLRVFKGVLDEGKNFTVKYAHVSRLPLRRATRERHQDGLIEEKPAEYFPPGKSLLFLKATPEAGVYAVQGAKLIQRDEVFDLGGEPGGWGSERLFPQYQPENSVLGDCLKYGEAELVADYLKGMKLLEDPSIPPQFEVVYRKDPLASDPTKTQKVALALSLIPVLVIGVAYRAGRSRLPKLKAFRRCLLGMAVVAAVVVGVQAYAVTVIRTQRPARWTHIRPGMTLGDLRCFVTSYEFHSALLMNQKGVRVITRQLHGLNISGFWKLRIHCDANEVIESATIYYQGDFGRLVPVTRLGAVK